MDEPRRRPAGVSNEVLEERIDHLAREMREQGAQLREAFRQEISSLKLDLVERVTRNDENVNELLRWRTEHELTIARTGGFEAYRQLQDRVHRIEADLRTIGGWEGIRSLQAQIKQLEDKYRDEETRRGVWRSQYTWFVSGVTLTSAVLGLLRTLGVY